jgi:hypothetical protein
MSGVRVLVCGGRDFRDRWAIYERLDMIHADRGIACIISGAASGADHIAANWAKDRGVDLREFPADWAKHGRAAGPIRNRQMLNDGQPNEVVAFAGGRGTADMIRAARTVGIPVWGHINDA